MQKSIFDSQEAVEERSNLILKAYNKSKSMEADNKRRMRFNQATDFEKYIRNENFHWFCTVTSKHHLTLKSARRVAEQIAVRIQRSGSTDFRPYDPSSDKNPDGLLFWVAEPHKHASCGYHLHFLLRLPWRYDGLTNRSQFNLLLDVSRKSVGGQKWLNKKGDLGLWHRVLFEPYRGHKASEYCAKYVTKYATDYDFIRIL